MNSFSSDYILFKKTTIIKFEILISITHRYLNMLLIFQMLRHNDNILIKHSTLCCTHKLDVIDDMKKFVAEIKIWMMNNEAE